MCDCIYTSIHENPVRAGLIEKEEGYLYPNAENYAGLKGLIEVDAGSTIAYCKGDGRGYIFTAANPATGLVFGLALATRRFWIPAVGLVCTCVATGRNSQNK